jgi:hypothetical protein
VAGSLREVHHEEQSHIIQMVLTSDITTVGNWFRITILRSAQGFSYDSSSSSSSSNVLPSYEINLIKASIAWIARTREKDTHMLVCNAPPCTAYDLPHFLLYLVSFNPSIYVSPNKTVSTQTVRDYLLGVST